MGVLASSYKFPFNYFALYDSKKNLIKTAFNKKDLVKIQKGDQKIIAENYAGCPCWQSSPSPESPREKNNDDFDLDSF
jgi:hypothetical protein